MKYKVHISARAERDVEQVLRWFQAQRASDAGAWWYARLMAKIDTLEQRPLRCRLAEEAEETGIELRELWFGRKRGMYRILFVVCDNAVDILRIRHGARDALTGDDL